MPIAYNNFLIVQLQEKLPGNIDAGIYSYANDVSPNAWHQNCTLESGKVISVNKYCKNNSSNEFAYNKDCTYVNGDDVIFDPTKIIHRFEDNSVLIREDAIVALYDPSNDMPVAGENQIVLQPDINNFEFADVSNNGIVGKVCDIGPIEEMQDSIDAVEGDVVIVVNPSIDWNFDNKQSNLYGKVSTSKGFFVIANVKAIACKL